MIKSLESKQTQNSLRSVDNALALLEAFEHSASHLSVTELSLKLGVAKSTISRLLTTLSARGYVQKNPITGKYSIGLKLFEIGSIAVAHLTPRDEARPILEQLMLTTQETVHMGVLDQGEVVYIEKIESSQALSMFSKIGRRAPLHCTSLGKAILAFQPAPEIKALVFSELELKSFTEKTIRDREKLMEELNDVKRKGYAVDDEEFALGLYCLSAPIRDFKGKVVASVGIGGPAVRLRETPHPHFVEEVMQAAASISTRLGYLPGR